MKNFMGALVLLAFIAEINARHCRIGYKQFEYLVKDEGNLLWVEKGIENPRDCEPKCDAWNSIRDGRKKCRSFGYCPGSKECYMADQNVYSASSLQTSRRDGCYTVYQACGEGN